MSKSKASSRSLNHPFKILLTVLMLGFASLARAEAPADQPQNIILITIDTLRADHVGSYGYRRKVTPFLDRLSRRGVRFENVIASSSHTAPSHATLFTSLYPIQHQLLSNGYSLQEEYFTMAEMFRGFGFKTAAFIAVNFLNELKQGFQTFKFGDHPVDSVREVQREAGKAQGPRSVPAEQQVDQALEWFRKTQPEERLFLWIHFYDVRLSKDIPDESLTPIEFEGREENDTFDAYYREVFAPSPEFAKRKKLKSILEKYDFSIRMVDAQIRRLFNQLQSEGRNNKTLWIFTSDHGQGLGNHRYYGHEKYIYQEQLRVPLIFYFTEGLYPGRRITELVRLVDILPTLEDLIQTPLEGSTISWQGVSLMPLIRGQSSGFEKLYGYAERPVSASRRPKWTGNVFSLQDLRHKYIFNSEAKDEFYDLQADPHELNNLIDEDATGKEEIKTKLFTMYESMEKLANQKRPGSMDEKYLAELQSLGYVN